MSPDYMCSHLKRRRKWKKCEQNWPISPRIFRQIFMWITNVWFNVRDWLLLLLLFFQIAIIFFQFEHEMCAHLNDRPLTARPNLLLFHIQLAHSTDATLVSLISYRIWNRTRFAKDYIFIHKYVLLDANRRNYVWASGNILRVEGFRRRTPGLST